MLFHPLGSFCHCFPSFPFLRYWFYSSFLHLDSLASK
jgi:hypothetical protein